MHPLETELHDPQKMERISVSGDGLPFGGVRKSSPQDAIVRAEGAIAGQVAAHVTSIDHLSSKRRCKVLWHLARVQRNRLLSRVRRRKQAALLDLLRPSYERHLDLTEKRPS